ncbi:MAG TPA: hypothetical protein VN706_11600 [Gemmatimonadaceae bacterium]|nr:hypothetical protein [Gemmatimonadaceae bacterium]
MSATPKRVREQAVVYLGDRDRALLDDLAHETGLSRTELFRRGLWALAEQLRAPNRVSGMELLITMSKDVDGPPDLSERADDYLYGGGYDAYERSVTAVAESPSELVPSAQSGEPKELREAKRPRKRGPGRGARSR